MSVIAKIREKHGYLRARGYIDTLLTFETETHQYLTNYRKQPLFLKQLLISGKFKQVESYLECLITDPEELKKVNYLIKKQYFLELISKRPEEKDTNRVLELLNGLENELESEMFEELCELLAMKSIREKKEFENWSILRGRENCFKEILPFIENKLGESRLDTPRDVDYLKCFRGLLLSQKFDFLDKKKLRILENFEDDRGIMTEFLKLEEGEDGFGDLENSKIIEILDETLQENYSNVSARDKHSHSIYSHKQTENPSYLISSKIDKNPSFQNSPKNEILQSLKEIQQSNDLRPTDRSNSKFGGSYIENLEGEEEERMNKSSHINIYGFSSDMKNSQQINPDDEEEKIYKEIEKEEEISRLIPSKILSQKVEYLSTSQISQKTLDQIKGEFNGKENNFINSVSKGLQEMSKEDFHKSTLNNIYSSYQSNFSPKRNQNRAQFLSEDNFKVIYEGSDTLPIRAAAFSQDGQYFSIGSNSRVLNVYSIQNILFNYNEKSSERKNLLVSILDLHQGPIYSIDYASGRDMIASGSMDKSVKLVTLSNPEGENSLKKDEDIFIGSHRGMVRSVKFTLDSKQILSAGQDTNLKLWDVETQELIQKFKTSCNHTYCARFTHDQNTIIGVGADKYIQLWDKRSGKTSHMAHIGNLSKMNYLSLEHNQYSESFFNVANYAQKTNWTGNRMVVGHQSGEVSFWDLRSLDECQSVLRMHEEDCRSVEFDPSCRFLTTSSFDCSIKIFDLEEEKFTHTLSEHQDRAVMARWHPYLPFLVSTSADCTFKVYATENFLGQCDF